MPFFERLKWNYIFECSDDKHVWYEMKACISANMKAKHAKIQKLYVFADTMYIFSENGSLTLILHRSFAKRTEKCRDALVKVK